MFILVTFRYRLEVVIAKHTIRNIFWVYGYYYFRGRYSNSSSIIFYLSCMSRLYLV